VKAFAFLALSVNEEAHPVSAETDAKAFAFLDLATVEEAQSVSAKALSIVE
jgi:hypothetical protein